MKNRANLKIRACAVLGLFAAASVWAVFGRAPAATGAEGGPRAAPPEAGAQQRAQIVQRGIAQCDAALQDLDQRMPALADDVQRLLERVAAIRIPDKHEPPPQKPPPKQVPFRPPRERLTPKREITFVCQNNLVSSLDLEQVTVEVEQRTEGADGERAVRFDLPNSDFRIEGTVGPDSAELQVVRKGTQYSETWEQAQRAGSRFQTVLASRDREKYYAEFLVWPDSYGLYHKLRSLAWNKDYEVGWSPKEAGGGIELVYGPGVGISH